MKKVIGCFILLILYSSNIKSQTINNSVNFSKAKLVSTEIDTARLLSDKPIKSPMGALLRSAVLPGLGQMYNQKYIKGIFVFAINGTLGYKIYDYHKEWNDTGETKFRDKRNLFTWYFGLSYMLTLIDAYIDAYLFGFDEAIEIAALKLNDDNKNYFVLNVKFNL
jgi:hypothetical protein